MSNNLLSDGTHVDFFTPDATQSHALPAVQRNQVDGVHAEAVEDTPVRLGIGERERLNPPASLRVKRWQTAHPDDCARPWQWVVMDIADGGQHWIYLSLDQIAP
jgi:hypothetical protein